MPQIKKRGKEWFLEPEVSPKTDSSQRITTKRIITCSMQVCISTHITTSDIREAKMLLASATQCWLLLMVLEDGRRVELIQPSIVRDCVRLSRRSMKVAMIGTWSLPKSSWLMQSLATMKSDPAHVASSILISSHLYLPQPISETQATCFSATKQQIQIRSN